MNNRLTVTGTVNVSLDNSKYDGVTFEGYCLDKDNKRYNIYGPQDGSSLYINGNSYLSLSEVLEDNYNVDWNNVTITYCKIDTMNAYVSKSGIGSLTSLATAKVYEINYEKNF